MRHDPKYSQSHLSAVRQKTMDERHMYSNTFYHHKHGYRRHEADERYYNGGGTPRHTGEGGTVSALSGSSHEAEKQWEWLESVLEKSKTNRETVR